MKLLKQSNWMHLIGMCCVSYILLYWGNTTKGTLFPSSMIYDLANLDMYVQFLLHVIFSLVLGIGVNLIELHFLKVGFDNKELIAGAIGVGVAFLVWMFLPLNLIFFITACVGLFSFVSYITLALVVGFSQKNNY